MNTIFCHYLKKEEQRLESTPYTGGLDTYLLENISQPAWELWRAQQTRLINEYRLVPYQSQTKKFLREKMCEFFQIQDLFD